MWLRRTMSDGRRVSLRASSSGCGERGEVLAVGDVLHVPAVRLEALPLVLGVEAERGGAVDRDAVVVVDVDQPAEPEVAGDRRGFLRDAFHQVAVRADREDVRVDDLVARAVVALGQEPVCDRQPDAVGEPLSQRPGRRLDARGVPELGVSRRARTPLAKRAQVVERDVVAGQVQRRVLEHAGVACGEDEPVAARARTGWPGCAA